MVLQLPGPGTVTVWLLLWLRTSSDSRKMSILRIYDLDLLLRVDPVLPSYWGCLCIARL